MRKKTVTLTCSQCGHKQLMQVPSDKCQAFYKCDGCGKTIAAKKTCCVFCEYGDRKCAVGHSGRDG